MKNYVYINGIIAPEEEARLSTSDRGFLLGDGLFETILAVEGAPIFLEAHLTRLKKGLHTLMFRSSSLQGFFKDIEGGFITRLIKKNDLFEKMVRVRVTISRGYGAEVGLAPSPDSTPTIIISASPLDMEKIRRKADEGISAITVKGFRPALPGLKSLNFMPNIMAASMAKTAGAGEGFFLASDNKTLLEGTSSNIFIVRRGRLLTTPAARETGGPGALSGVVRQITLKLAKEAEIPAEEGWFTTDDLQAAEEVFITNSISGLAPVTEVDSRPVAGGRPGAITRLLQKAYEKKISEYMEENGTQKKI